MADEMFEVYKKGGDLKSTLMAGRSVDNITFWLDNGDNFFGWTHIVKKHITGELPRGTLFPTGLSQSTIKDVIEDTMKTGKKVTILPDGTPIKPGNIGYQKVINIPGVKSFVNTVIVNMSEFVGSINTSIPFY